MMPIAPLMIEHRLIERMVKLMGRHVGMISSSSRADTHFIGSAVDFIRVYADRCHHGKEEDLLFPLLQQKGMPRAGGLVGMMLAARASGPALARA